MKFRNSGEIGSAKRQGFTLVELLVVITIIGMLLALLMPAVQAARESARRAQCLSNQKQLTIAAMAFDSSSRKYPGYQNTVAYGTSGQTTIVSWMGMLLPNIERNDIYQQIKLGTAVGTYGKPIKLLACPSDPPDVMTGNVGPCSYTANGLVFRDGTLNSVYPPRSSDYVSSNDGTSETLMISEALEVDQKSLNGGVPHYWWDSTSTGKSQQLANQLNTFGVQLPNFYTSSPARAYASAMTYPAPTTTPLLAKCYVRSNHGGGVVAGFCDGHCVFVRDDTGLNQGTGQGGSIPGGGNYAANILVFAELITPDGTTVPATGGTAGQPEPPIDESQL